MTIELVVVGASWGGLKALGQLLGGLPPDLGAAVAIAQHRRPDDGPHLAQVLARQSSLPVHDAEDKDQLLADHVYLAPADYHLLVEPDALALSTDEPEQYSRPAIDVLFDSAADAYGERVVGVILTGANHDGAAGLRRIRRHGGLALVQDPATADRPEMPRAALALAGADAVLAVDDMGAWLAQRCRPLGVSP